MKLSTRSTYGMRALVELALTSGRGPVSAALIAKRQNLSVAYLEQLLHRLKRQGLVSSFRGPQGGYVLAKDPRQITMAEVVRILDGTNSAWNGADLGAVPKDRRGSGPRARAREGSAKEVHRHAQRIARAVWRCVHERLTQSLSAVTLQDLCEEVRAEAGEPLDHRYVFHI
ncbi:MAG: Rrf2 family transcriptional regulator [Candidatus Omnitrophica bacterium]|nr:Rrf2 family transcriptional regulator [Candidatus Omnitrophota bacterium]MBI2496123.1 Rrf2 family transcriptional regulator [Candidatus Omnitrophota bacterium]MBI3020637.1 Rrf2 family transcriptional regulator [Candidatus Omnitrophota bacterium]MBI3082835.1 Rrf2 family transcriptional regulator [Candidatus Omnitrophota bacterium]